MASKGFRRQRLLDIKDLLLQVEAVSLREQEDIHQNNLVLLADRQKLKEDYLSSGTAATPTAVIQGARDLLARTWYTLQLNAEIGQQIYFARKSRDAVEKQRKSVEEAAQAKRTLEKLKQHQNEAASLENDRDDQKALDEVAARTYLRSSHGRAVG